MTDEPQQPLYALPAIAAYAAEVDVATLRRWAHRGHISKPVRGCYDLHEIDAYIQKRDAAGHSGRARAGAARRGETRA